MTIGSRIQALRKERGMSQEELANKLSVSRQTVSQWETGQTAPSIDNIYTLKDIFGKRYLRRVVRRAHVGAADGESAKSTRGSNPA